jgi:hypothetical protein
MPGNKKPRKKYKEKPCVKPLGIRDAHQLEFPGYSASLALGQGHFEEQHVYDLLSNADLTRRIAPDGHPVLPIAQAMVDAVAGIQERAQRLGKHGVNAEEMRILREGIGKTMDYLRTVPNVDIWRAAKAATDEFNRHGALRV